MEKKINIAELLKDCPQGMELDCALWDDVKFDEVEMGDSYPICIKVGEEYEHLTEFGHWDLNENAKCVIYPKGKTTWEGFVPPYFKDGDILVGKANQPFIFQSFNCGDGCYSYCGITADEQFLLHSDDWTFANSLRFATEEEKLKLFLAIKDNGYKWNEETKTLEKLVEPRFKVGDRIFYALRKHMGVSEVQCVISDITDDRYFFTDGSNMSISTQDNWELVPNKFDINTLIPFESKVLVRDYDNEIWRVSFWGCLINCEYSFKFKYDTTRGCYKQCIPYEGNEYLLGKKDDCKDFYKTW